MLIEKNILLKGVDKMPMTLDIFIEDETIRRPVVIYAHGFNGFKDWGNFDLIAKKFAAFGYVFVKFNFSHNGTSPEHPEEFVDLEAFGNNNYSIELEDLRLVIDWICAPSNKFSRSMDLSRLTLLGHSMGGGITMLQAAKDKRVKKLITWASISECKTPWGNWPAEKMKEWKENGVQYYTNTRTKQEMPLRYQLYKDYVTNHEKLDIENAIKSIDIPIMLCHGTVDNSVPIASALKLQSWQPSAQLFTVQSDHVFGRSHPWTSNDLPPAMNAVLEASLEFLKD